VLFAVICESTYHIDHIEELREYEATPSNQRYVTLEQEAIAAVTYSRKGADLIAETVLAADTLRMPVIGIAIPMAAFYASVELAVGSSPTEQAGR
jgi:hypothetical protein